jgi:hypothetical protein
MRDHHILAQTDCRVIGKGGIRLLKPLRTRVGQRLQGKYPLKCVVLFMALALVFFPVHVRAQSDAENVVKSLSARVQNIVKRLQARGTVEIPRW